MAKTAIIIGAGPAGLTAAYELLQKTDIQPIILEAANQVGGIAKTLDYRGNKIDLGGHRFFSKSSQVMSWWLSILPLQGQPAKDDILFKRPKAWSQTPSAPDPERQDKVMLLRQRISRIYYRHKFFAYPVTINWQTVKNLGFSQIIIIGLSYLKALLFPLKPEKSLEDFIINRFGHKLYKIFFQDYTAKVWGVAPKQIPADWGQQRIKGVSVKTLLKSAAKLLFGLGEKDLKQNKTETSLISQFIYPKFGPGQLWEEVARKILSQGGQIFFQHKVTELQLVGKNIQQVTAVNSQGQRFIFPADYFFSTMPIQDLIAGLAGAVPLSVQQTAEGLVYRDLKVIGLLVKKLKLKNNTNVKRLNELIPDNWIYIQEPDVRLGRLQIFNNWSPYLVKDFDQTVWLGLEYFCTAGDNLWRLPDKDFLQLGIDELVKIGVIDKADWLDGCVIAVPKAYPAYFGSYQRFNLIKDFVNQIENLFLIGRNGLHRYNNMDHSMLSAMTAVANIVNQVTKKDNIWQINNEAEYQENRP